MNDSCATTKYCRRCDSEKPSDQFGNDRSRSDGKYPYCKPCARDYNNTWRSSGNRTAEAYNERMRKRAQERRLLDKHDLNRYDKQLLKRYGADLGTYDRVFEEQNGRCAICRCTPDAVDGQRRLHFDHNHETGEFRGLLCMFCNQGLGRFKDDPILLRLAIEYLLR